MIKNRVRFTYDYVIFNQNDGCFKQPLVTAKVRRFFKLPKLPRNFFFGEVCLPLL